MVKKTDGVELGRKVKSPTPGGKRGRGRPPKVPLTLSEILKRLAAMSPAKYLSPNEAGLVLGVTGEAVKYWIHQRRLPAIKLANGFYRIKVSDLVAHVKSHAGTGPRPIPLIAWDRLSKARLKGFLGGRGHSPKKEIGEPDRRLEDSPGPWIVGGYYMVAGHRVGIAVSYADLRPKCRRPRLFVTDIDSGMKRLRSL